MLACQRDTDMNGGDLVADVLVRQRVRFLFTLCGGHISPILVSAKGRGIRVVDTRHEATAVFAADAVARLTGVPGVAAVTAGPGVTNTLTALQNALVAQSPLVLLGGATATLLRGRGALQDVDQTAIVRPHVKRAMRVGRVRDLVPVVEEAFRACREGLPGPVFVECPVDVVYPEDLVRKWYGDRTGDRADVARHVRRWYVSRHLERLFRGAESVRAADPVPVPAPRPSEANLRRAASLLARAERPVLLVGSQALSSATEAPALAEAVGALGIPVYLSGIARGLLGPAHALQLRHGRRQALREADLVLLAGVPCDFRLDYGRHIGRRAVLISANRSPDEMRRSRRPTLAVPGAPELFLRGLAAPGERAGWGPWLETLRARDAAREAEIRGRAEAHTEGGLNPLSVCRAIERALAEDSVIVADGGDFVSTASYILRPRRPLSWLDPGPFGTLGVGAGFALGARLARPEAEVWILYGDGSVGYSLTEADTFARHGLGVIAVIGNDAAWTEIAREQVEMLRDDVGTVLAPTSYEKAVEGLGARGMRLEDPDRVDDVLAQARALARGGQPVYVNARIGRTDFRNGAISM
jgi:acetolactate synthase-1/2/3 large subunit